MTWRELSNLIEQLPYDARTRRKIVGEFAEWTPLHHLIATAIDCLLVANWQRANQGAKRPTPPKPPQLPRPEPPTATKEVPVVRPGEARRFVLA